MNHWFVPWYLHHECFTIFQESDCIGSVGLIIFFPGTLVPLVASLSVGNNCAPHPQGGDFACERVGMLVGIKETNHGVAQDFFIPK